MSKVLLKDIADIQSGPFGTQLHKDEYVPNGVFMPNAKNIGNGNIITDSMDFVSEQVCKRLPRYILQSGDILFGRAGSIERHAYVGNDYSTDTWCITASGEMSDYLYLLLLSIKPELNQKYFQGTGLKHLQKPMLKDRPIYIPATKELETFNKTLQPWFDMIASNVTESQSLVALRDWLLPMLMNGQAVIED